MTQANDVEIYVSASHRHGEDSDPDHEVGDLQTLLRAAWDVMTEKQRERFAELDAVKAVLDE